MVACVPDGLPRGARDDTVGDDDDLGIVAIKRLDRLDRRAVAIQFSEQPVHDARHGLRILGREAAFAVGQTGHVVAVAVAGARHDWHPDRAQYALVLLAVAFTWLMGLMGYIRSGIRQHWHVMYVMRDNSLDAYTPSLAYAANVVSVGTVLFLGMVIFVFWISQLGAREQAPAAQAAR